LSFAEQRRLEEYNREREAMEATTSVKGNLPSEDREKQTAESDPLQAIQAALINARTALGVNPTQSGVPQFVSSQYTAAGQPEQRTDYERQNDQEQKATFGQQHGKQESDYLASTRKPAQSRYEIKAGWLIPAVLEQQLNSDLPGLIRALVRENVYDSATGRYILIPSGSTLIGVYNSHIGYGQNALQAVWRRVVFPDGSSLALGGFEGDDSAGAAGFRDQVNNHWGRILSGALLTSLFAAGIEVSQGTNSSVLQSPSVGQTVGQAVGQQVGQLGVEVTRRNLNIQPTIVVRPGYRFFVRVEKDIPFNGPYSPMRAESESQQRLGNNFGRASSGSEEGGKEGSAESEPRWAAVDGRPSGNDAAPPH
jgi:type IV secretory pathway VirB10-like protein